MLCTLESAVVITLQAPLVTLQAPSVTRQVLFIAFQPASVATAVLSFVVTLSRVHWPLWLMGHG